MDLLTEQIIAATLEVHRILGPGLLESIYEEALCYELSLRGISFEGQDSLMESNGFHYSSVFPVLSVAELDL